MTSVRTAARRRARVMVALATALVALPGCAVASPDGGQGAGTGSSRVVAVVAAEDMWGSLAAQVGGSHARVTSLVASPATDPHAYEPTAADARRLADAGLAVVNGAGYDPWMDRLLAAAGGHRRVLDVGDLARVAPGADPHLWYRPDVVDAVVAALARDLAAVDPADAGFFAARGRQVAETGLAGYHAALASIRSRFAGRPVAATESVAAPLCRALGLDLLTPPAFLRAVTEGIDPSPAARAAAVDQVTSHRVDLLLVNTQNQAPDVRTLVDAAHHGAVPTVALTETLVPATATFQAWQTRQLTVLARTLEDARG